MSSGLNEGDTPSPLLETVHLLSVTSLKLFDLTILNIPSMTMPYILTMFGCTNLDSCAISFIKFASCVQLCMCLNVFIATVIGACPCRVAINTSPNCPALDAC